MREREHPRDVERDVPDPDHDRPLDVEVELELLEIGMAVVPGDELRGRPRAGQVLAGDAEPAVGLRADGVDDGVVQAHEVLVVEVAADLDVAEEAEAGLSAIRSNARETVFSFGWSGATPSRTSPHGVGRRSIMSTSAGGSADSNAPAA